MPLFGGQKPWPSHEVDLAVKRLSIAQEMPAMPYDADYANLGRAAVVGGLDGARMQQCLDQFFAEALRFDLYREERGLPTWIKVDRDGGIQTSRLEDAARYRCLWNHWASTIERAADFALGVAASRIGLAYDRAGEVGSPRWDHAREQLLSLALHGRPGGRAKTMRDEFRIALGVIKYFTDPDAPGGADGARKRAEALFDLGLDGRSIATTHEVCRCGCSVRIAPAE